MITILDNVLLRLRELRDKHNKEVCKTTSKTTMKFNYD